MFIEEDPVLSVLHLALCFRSIYFNNIRENICQNNVNY